MTAVLHCGDSTQSVVRTCAPAGSAPIGTNTALHAGMDTEPWTAVVEYVRIGLWIANAMIYGWCIATYFRPGRRRGRAPAALSDLRRTGSGITASAASRDESLGAM